MKKSVLTKTLLAVSLALAIVLSLAACGAGEKSSSSYSSSSYSSKPTTDHSTVSHSAASSSVSSQKTEVNVESSHSAASSKKEPKLKSEDEPMWDIAGTWEYCETETYELDGKTYEYERECKVKVTRFDENEMRVYGTVRTWYPVYRAAYGGAYDEDGDIYSLSEQNAFFKDGQLVVPMDKENVEKPAKLYFSQDGTAELVAGGDLKTAYVFSGWFGRHQLERTYVAPKILPYDSLKAKTLEKAVDNFFAELQKPGSSINTSSAFSNTIDHGKRIVSHNIVNIEYLSDLSEDDRERLYSLAASPEDLFRDTLPEHDDLASAVVEIDFGDDDKGLYFFHFRKLTENWEPINCIDLSYYSLDDCEREGDEILLDGVYLTHYFSKNLDMFQ